MVLHVHGHIVVIVQRTRAVPATNHQDEGQGQGKGQGHGQDQENIGEGWGRRNMKASAFRGFYLLRNMPTEFKLKFISFKTDGINCINRSE